MQQYTLTENDEIRRLTLSKTLEVLVEAYEKIQPQMKTIEKRVRKLEQAVS